MPNSSADGASSAERTLINALLAAILALAAFTVYELHSFFGEPLSDTPELRVACVAREMLQSGNWILPTLGGEPRLKKPPLPYWLAALSAKIFTPNAENDPRAMARAAQLPPAASGAIAVFVAGLLGCIFFGRLAGLMAGAMLASCELVMRFAQLGYCDSTLMLCCVLSACCVTRLLTRDGGLFTMLLGAAALGAGILTKGPIAPLLLIAPTLAAAIVRRKELIKRNFVLLGLMFVLGLAIAAPWFVLVERQHPGAMNEMLTEASDGLRRTAPSTPIEPQIAGHRQNDRWTYYFYKGALGLLPWTALIAMELIALVPLLAWRRKLFDAKNVHLQFFLLYAVCGFLVFLLSEKKQGYYLLPMFPAIALVLGAWHARMVTPGGFVEERMGWAQLGMGVLIAALLGSARWWPDGIAWLQSHGIARAGYVATNAGEISARLDRLAIPLAAGIFVLSCVFARQWIGGRGHWVVFALAAFALIGAATVDALPAERARNTAFWESVEKINATLAGEAQNAKFYAPGIDDSRVLFYTGRKARSIREFADGAPGAGQVVLLIQGDSLKNAAQAFKFKLDGLPAGDSPEFSTTILNENAPPLDEVRRALKEWQTRRER